MVVMKNDVSKALVERLAGHRGIGDSSRTARLTVIRAQVTRIIATACETRAILASGRGGK